ncbi:MAG: hypothetical protein LDL31_00045 [Prosthecobacter sp.]|nr:hypothetical protein [Prosthecobacter sp.]
MKLAQQLLLMLLLLTTTGEAATLELGVISHDKDQVHDLADHAETYEDLDETRGNDSSQDTDPFSATPTCGIGHARMFLHQVTPSLVESQEAKPCGKQRRHRWVNVDLN